MGAHFPMVRTLEGFSQTEQSAIDPRVLRELAQLEWLEQAQTFNHRRVWIYTAE